MLVSAAGRKLQFRCQLSWSALVDTKSAFGLGPIPYVLCVCECVRLNVWLCMCVLHCNSSGQSSRGCLFCWWLKQLAIERKDWTVGESQLSCAIKASSPLLSNGFPLCPKHSVPTSPTTMSFMKTSAEYCFQLCISHISTGILPVLQPPSSRWWPKGNSAERKALFCNGKEENNNWLSEHHWIPGVFCVPRTFPLHCCASFMLVSLWKLQPVQCKLWPSWRELPVY